MLFSLALQDTLANFFPRSRPSLRKIHPMASSCTAFGGGGGFSISRVLRAQRRWHVILCYSDNKIAYFCPPKRMKWSVHSKHQIQRWTWCFQFSAIRRPLEGHLTILHVGRLHYTHQRHVWDVRVANIYLRLWLASWELLLWSQNLWYFQNTDSEYLWMPSATATPSCRSQSSTAAQRVYLPTWSWVKDQSLWPGNGPA